jgi:hypothetical protein
MSYPLAVSSLVVIGDGCPIRYHVSCSAETNFLCGGPADGLALRFQAGALREFLHLAAEALREIDARNAREAQRAQESWYDPSNVTDPETARAC